MQNYQIFSQKETVSGIVTPLVEMKYATNIQELHATV